MIKQTLLTMACAFQLAQAATAQYSWDNLPKVKTTSFKADTINILRYGAKADGVFLNTQAINKAISDCHAKGGGVVLVPAGLWLTGPVELKSNVNLHLAKAAMLVFTTDKSQYPIVEGFYEGRAAARNQSPIWATGQENIAITGAGIIDGNGDAWRAVAKWQMTPAEWKAKLEAPGVYNQDSSEWYPSVQFREAKAQNKSMLLTPGKPLEAFGEMKDFLRPNLVVLNNCKRVLLEGVVFQNSPAWCLHLLLSEDLILRGVKTKNPEYAQNGDGMDIESCRNFIVEDCTLDVGDDAICIKSGKDEEGRRRGKPTENGIIRNNIIYKGHGGFVIGSEMSGGARNIFVENCIFNGTDKGLRFKSTRGRGGVVENIFVRNVSMKDIRQEAVFFDMYYFVKFATDGKREVAPGFNEGTPVFRNMRFSNLTCEGANTAIFIRGLPEMAVTNIAIENSTFTAKKGVVLKDAAAIRLEGLQFNLANEKAVITAEDVKGLHAGKISFTAAPGAKLLDAKNSSQVATD